MNLPSIAANHPAANIHGALAGLDTSTAAAAADAAVMLIEHMDREGPPRRPTQARQERGRAMTE
jgi:hypothetical protein